MQPSTCQLLYDGPKADKLATDKLPNAVKLLVEEVIDDSVLEVR